MASKAELAQSLKIIDQALEKLTNDINASRASSKFKDTFKTVKPTKRFYTKKEIAYLIHYLATLFIRLTRFIKNLYKRIGRRWHVPYSNLEYRKKVEHDKRLDQIDDKIRAKDFELIKQLHLSQNGLTELEQKIITLEAKYQANKEHDGALLDYVSNVLDVKI